MAKPHTKNGDLAHLGVVIENAIADYARVLSIFDIPRDQMAAMKAAALGQLRHVPRDKLSGLSASSALVTDAVRTGFSAVYGSLTEDQRRAMQLQRMTGQPIGVGGSVDAKGRILVDGVTGYVDRDGRKVDSRERHSTADYEKIAGGTVDRGTYNSLLRKGFSRQQINDAGAVAGVLGWNDSQSIRNLAVAGSPFSHAAADYEQARKRGDTQAMETADKKMHDLHDKTTDPKAQKAQDEVLKKLYQPHSTPEAQTAPSNPTKSPGAAGLFKKLTQSSPQ